LKNILLLFISVLFFISCKKNSSSNPSPNPTQHKIDTVAVLTNTKWLFIDAWIDRNNNGVVDSGEVEPSIVGLSAVYVLDSSGILTETTSWSSRSGTWYFTGGGKSKFAMAWSTNTDDFAVVAITDTTTTWYRLSTDEQWHMKKF